MSSPLPLPLFYIISFLLPCIITAYLIPLAAPHLLAKYNGHDLLKPRNSVPIPEATGVIAGTVYLIWMFLRIPSIEKMELNVYLASLLSLTSMVMLGFVDDTFNLRWRYKLWLPLIASIPILMVYAANNGLTSVVLPKQLPWKMINLGGFYYMYMALLSIFCTNAINILAGINGIEVGQSIIICGAMIINNCVNLFTPEHTKHLYSLNMMIPLLGVMTGLFVHNKYPASVFVGDTFCYFAGMTIAVTGVLSHSSKTVLLFFIPQILNFLYSLPQLIGLIPCPRHRLPRLDMSTGLLQPSYVVLDTKNSRRWLFLLGLLHRFWIVDLRSTTHNAHYGASSPHSISKTVLGPAIEAEGYSVNNLTILNLILHIFGPLSERQMMWAVILLQIFCCSAAFFIRYQLVHLVY